MNVHDLPTPALVVDADAFERNLATMARACPEARLRPHVKAHKCTQIAAAQARHGHRAFTCATPLEVIGMARAGFGDDLLLANECLDGERLAAMAALEREPLPLRSGVGGLPIGQPPNARTSGGGRGGAGALVTVAVDSEATIDAAARAGLRHVLVDVNVGLPRCGCPVDDAGRLADAARARGLDVRGVMGYEGHLMGIVERAERASKLVECVDRLLAAHALVGGEIISTGGTGTFDLHDDRVTEIQAGSYALMDTAYTRSVPVFEQALFVETTVISSSVNGWAVCDAGLKSLGMDHGNPSIAGATVWFCSDEHVTFSMDDGAPLPRAGDRISVIPAHVDPTMALHERVHVVRGERVIETWPIDLRGW